MKKYLFQCNFIFGSKIFNYYVSSHVVLPSINRNQLVRYEEQNDRDHAFKLINFHSIAAITFLFHSNLTILIDKDITLQYN